MSVERWGQVPIEDGQKGLKGRAADEPLEIGSSRVVVWAVEARPRNDLEQPAEEVLMAGMHSDGDRGLPAVAPEATLTHEDAEKKADLEGPRVRVWVHLSWSERSGSCYTVWYHVKH